MGWLMMDVLLTNGHVVLATGAWGGTGAVPVGTCSP